MHNIELSGIGFKTGTKINNIVGICYISKAHLPKDSSNTKDNMRSLVEVGNIMDLGKVRNIAILDKKQQLFTSTVNVNYSGEKMTAFTLHISRLFNDTDKDKFIRKLKKFPLMFIFNLKERTI